MNKTKQPTIRLPILAKDVFRVLALRSVVETQGLVQILNKSFTSICERITTTPRLTWDEPFQCEHGSLSVQKNDLMAFTERELCASGNAFFGKSFDGIGMVIDYELPLDNKKDSAFGKIDLISLTVKGELFLLEVKKCKSKEHPLRAMFEILTFWKLLEDKERGFDLFVEKYKKCPQFPKDRRFDEKKLKVIPGLLLCETSEVFKQLSPTGNSPAENELYKLYKRFLSKPIELRVFSYSADDLSVTDVTDTIKRNCGMDKSGS